MKNLAKNSSLFPQEFIRCITIPDVRIYHLWIGTEFWGDDVLVFRTFLSDASWLESLYINFSIIHLGLTWYIFSSMWIPILEMSSYVPRGRGVFCDPGHSTKELISLNLKTFYPPMTHCYFHEFYHYVTKTGKFYLVEEVTKWWDWFVHWVIKMAWMYCNFLPPPHASAAA